VNVHMSSTQYKYLQDYVDQKQNSTAEVHSILSSMLRDLRYLVVEFVSCYVAFEGELNLDKSGSRRICII